MAEFVLPTWAPSRAQVAGYVLTRTIPEGIPGEADPAGDFTISTTPTAAQVDEFIATACRWVLVAAAGVTDLGARATDAAALYAAALVELAVYSSGDDVTSAGSLLALAREARTEVLADVSRVGDNPLVGVLPQYTFPDAPWWGDVSPL